MGCCAFGYEFAGFGELSGGRFQVSGGFRQHLNGLEQWGHQPPRDQPGDQEHHQDIAQASQQDSDQVFPHDDREPVQIKHHFHTVDGSGILDLVERLPAGLQVEFPQYPPDLIRIGSEGGVLAGRGVWRRFLVGGLFQERRGIHGPFRAVVRAAATRLPGSFLHLFHFFGLFDFPGGALRIPGFGFHLFHFLHLLHRSIAACNSRPGIFRALKFREVPFTQPGDKALRFRAGGVGLVDHNVLDFRLAKAGEEIEEHLRILHDRTVEGQGEIDRLLVIPVKNGGFDSLELNRGQDDLIENYSHTE